MRRTRDREDKEKGGRGGRKRDKCHLFPYLHRRGIFALPRELTCLVRNQQSTLDRQRLLFCFEERGGENERVRWRRTESGRKEGERRAREGDSLESPRSS
jgi:hypothetical protein